MSVIDLQSSLARAEKRMGQTTTSRRPRRDRGTSRLHPEVLLKLEELLRGQDRLPVRSIQRILGEFCAARRLRPPARATIYESMARAKVHSFAIADLPHAARESLYNLPETGEVPGHQLAFYCLNYGGLDAISFAAGLPWLALYQADLLPGWRPRSHGLLKAIRLARSI
jgi:hypothetical protein